MSRWIKVNISLVTHSAGSLLDYKEYYKNKSNKGVTDTLSLHKVERNTLKKIYKALDKFRDNILPHYKSKELCKKIEFIINPIFREKFEFEENDAFIHRYDSKILIQLYATLRNINNDDEHIQREIKRIFYQSKIHFIESGVAVISDSYIGTDTLLYSSLKNEITIYKNKIKGIYRISNMINNEVDFNYDEENDTWFELNYVRYTVEEINNNKEYFEKLFEEFGILYKFIPIDY